MINTSLFTYVLLVLDFFPSFILAGKSTALGEEIETKEKELEKRMRELKENEIERKKVDEQNNYDGDNDSPNEANSAKELED
jgi:hypothetical protein